jgi:RIO-like serine/threonine protein kinase
MFLFKQVLAVVCHIMKAFTNLLVGIHRSKSALVARLPTLPSNILDLLLRSIGEVTRVGVIGHGDMYKVCSAVKSMERYVIDLIKLEYCREDSLRIYVRRQARPAS